MKYLFFTIILFVSTIILSQTPPMTRLTDVYCYNYNLPSLNSSFVAIKQSCDGYIFEVQNQTNMQTASFITYGSVAGRATNLSNFSSAGIQYSTTYRVRVRTWIGTTSNTSAFSATNCFVVTPAPTSKIHSSQCNATLSTLYSNIAADNVQGAEAFQYELTKQPSGPTNTYEKTTGTLNVFSLSSFSNAFIDYNTTYQVRVRVKVNGSYGPYGTVCNIITPSSVPNSQLENYCNSSISALNTPLFGVEVAGADAYKFQVTDGTNTTEVFPTAPGNNFVLIPVAWATYSGSPSNISWVTYNMTVQVRVSAFVDGIWQSFGPSCSVTTPCGSRLTQAMSGKTINYLHYDEISAETSACSNIQDYQFRYRLSGTSTTYVTASSGNEATDNATDNKIFIADFGPITNFPSSNPYGKSYRISVRLKINGTWSPWGSERIVNTVSSPTTKIRDGVYPVAGTSQCGSSFVSPFPMTNISTILGSYNLYGFANSTFEVTELDGSGNDVVTKTLTRDVATYGAMARAFRINMIDASSPDGTDGYWASKFNTVFRIRVKTNLGAYGAACFVRTPAAITIENTDNLISEEYSNSELVINEKTSEEESLKGFEDDILFFPNPYSNKLGIQYTEEFAGIVSYALFDISGKLIVSGMSTLDDLSIEDFWKTLKEGNYFISLTNEQKYTVTKKIIKNTFIK